MFDRVSFFKFEKFDIRLSFRMAAFYLQLFEIYTQEKISCRTRFKGILSSSVMSGANCAIFGCGINRCHKGIGIFKPASKTEHPEWRSKWINIITRDRVVDRVLKERIDNDSVFVYEKHFSPEENITSK